MPRPDSQTVEKVRRFNRFYTRQIGLLNEGLLKSPLSLAEMRVLYELAHTQVTNARDLGRELGMDAGYLSRILKGFRDRGWVIGKPSPSDGRQQDLELTATGRMTFGPYDKASADEIGDLLATLDRADQARLVDAMTTIETVLAPHPAASSPEYIVRPHKPGDIGWVISRHAALYAEEYGWDRSFEAMVAEIAGSFIRNFDPQREHCWIAERNGQPVGSIFCVRQDERVAKLRMLIVDPSARGLGVGDRLVSECISFARAKGYSVLTLWTNDILMAARHIYQRHGFRLVEEKPHESFGHRLVGQNWDLAL